MIVAETVSVLSQYSRSLLVPGVYSLYTLDLYMFACTDNYDILNFAGLVAGIIQCLM